MKLLLDNLPPSLQSQRETIESCLLAMGKVMPLQAVYLFGSHARGEARADSDVDLCVVSFGAENQIQASSILRNSLWPIWPRPALTLIPIAPNRLAEKKSCHDHFFQTVMSEGVLLVQEN
jgi:predicted nucleotidyltransferase